MPKRYVNCLVPWVCLGFLFCSVAAFHAPKTKRAVPWGLHSNIFIELV